MDKLIYMSVHLVCLVYILYKVWGWKSKVYEICILLYEKKSEKNFVKHILVMVIMEFILQVMAIIKKHLKI